MSCSSGGGGGGSRKRTYSVSSGGGGGATSNKINSNLNNNANVAAGKKKKKYNRTTTAFVPPTKFLLGGNIRDPLNLNGLPQDEEDQGVADEKLVDKDVVLPPLDDFLLGGNINDPLNLKGIAAADGGEQQQRQQQQLQQQQRLHSLGDVDVDDMDNDNDRQHRLRNHTLCSHEPNNHCAASLVNEHEHDHVRIHHYPHQHGHFSQKGNENVKFDGVDCDPSHEQFQPPLPPRPQQRQPELSTDVRLPVDRRNNSARNKHDDDDYANAKHMIARSGTDSREDAVFHSKAISGRDREGEMPASEVKLANLHLNVCGGSGKKTDRKDKIVSPVIPQPYRPLKTVPFRQIITPDLGTKAQKTPKFREKNTRFQYGNYRRYYGYRNAAATAGGGGGIDLRIGIFKRHRELFEGKDVLDVGCHVGHMSFVMARSLGARSVTGVDIDRHLIEVARTNVQYYVNCPSPYLDSTAAAASAESPSNQQQQPPSVESASGRKVDLRYKCYPVSMPILYGPILDDDFESGTRRKTCCFPKNVRFVHANYVPESEASLTATGAVAVAPAADDEQQQQQLLGGQYDTIVCLSVTKWIHLNWGDDGLKLAFKRMYAQLKPGGVLVLEPQSWDSYKKKKSLTESIWRNYRRIQFFPHHFDRYLLSSEVGFSRCHTLAVVNHQHKGFRRAIKVFEKPFASLHSTTVSPLGGDLRLLDSRPSPPSPPSP